MKLFFRALLPAFFLACILLGGASAAGYVANFALQVLAIGLLVMMWIVPRRSPVPVGEKWLRAVLLVASVVALLQFLPLPASVWRALDERQHIAEVNAAAGYQIARFVTLLPLESIKSLVWLLPALATLALSLRARTGSPQDVSVAITAGTVLSVAVSAAQVAGGSESPFYFYDITNRGSGVGFFANSNHLATLLLVTIPFTFALARSLLDRFQQHMPIIAGSAAAILLVTFAGIFTNNSLAGYILSLPVLGASLAMLDVSGRVRRFAPIGVAVLAIGGLAFAFVSSEGSRALDRTSGFQHGARQVVFARTLDAALDNLPTGSGIGTFAEIYRQYEDPVGVDREYINHAHNDYLELFLETGIGGTVVVLFFLGWWTWRAARIMRSIEASIFARAAVIASGTVLLHSLVDYPLRTAVISAVFAFSLGLMARWTPGDPIAVMQFGVRRSTRTQEVGKSVSTRVEPETAFSA